MSCHRQNKELWFPCIHQDLHISNISSFYVHYRIIAFTSLIRSVLNVWLKNRLSQTPQIKWYSLTNPLILNIFFDNEESRWEWWINGEFVIASFKRIHQLIDWLITLLPDDSPDLPDLLEERTAYYGNPYYAAPPPPPPPALAAAPRGGYAPSLPSRQPTPAVTVPVYNYKYQVIFIQPRIINIIVLIPQSRIRIDIIEVYLLSLWFIYVYTSIASNFAKKNNYIFVPVLRLRLSLSTWDKDHDRHDIKRLWLKGLAPWSLLTLSHSGYGCPCLQGTRSRQLRTQGRKKWFPDTGKMSDKR